MALADSTVWEVRGTGNDQNGGGYVPGAGTDYSQQNSAQLSVTDADASGTTNLHSATGGFTSAMVNNVLQLSGGTLTTGFYQITAFVDGNNVTIDRSPGTGSGSTCKVGGALATPTKASDGMIAKNMLWIKATGSSPDYDLTAQTTVNNVNSALLYFASNVFIYGYVTTRGDGTIGCVTLKANASNPATWVVFISVADGGGLASFKWLTLDANNRTNAAYGILASGAQATGVVVKSFLNYAFNGVACYRCVADNSALGSRTGVGFNTHFQAECYAEKCSTGFNDSYGSTGCIAFDCQFGFITGTFTTTNGVAANCSAGFTVPGNNSYVWYHRCVAYNCTSRNYYVDSPHSRITQCFSFGSANLDIVNGEAQDLTVLGTDPFVNAAGLDFTPVTGSPIRGQTGIIGLTSTTTYMDAGAAQHQDSGGGGTPFPRGRVF